MWTMLVEPTDVCRHLIPHRIKVQWHDQASKPFLLERLDEPFNHGDAPVTMNRSVARPDFLPLAPCHEAFARELHSFVADDVLRTCPVPVDHFSEKGSHGCGAWLLLEHRET